MNSKSIVGVVLILFVVLGVGAYGINSKIDELNNELSATQEKVVILQNKLDSVQSATDNNSAILVKMNESIVSLDGRVSSLSKNVSMNGFVANNAYIIANAADDKANQAWLMANQTSEEVSSIESEVNYLEYVVSRLKEAIQRQNANSNKSSPYSTNMFYGQMISEDDVVSIFEQQADIGEGAIAVGVDDYYYALPYDELDDFVKFIQWTGIPNWKYENESRDCDDFALELYAQIDYYYPLLASGEVFTENHHVFDFVIVDKDGQLILYYIEPQTGEVWPAEDSSMIYYLGVILIIF